MSNIFETKVDMPEKTPTEEHGALSMYPPGYVRPPDPPQSDPVRVVMTPVEERTLSRSNYPRYSAMDVQNIDRPRRGFKY